MKDFTFQEVLFEFKILDSTNLEATRKIESLEGGLCFAITAGVQTDGRGRLERKWESSSAGNIYMTLAIEENLLPLELRAILPLYTAFSLIKAINSDLTKYKWPNDLLIEGKKFCGVLCQKYKGFFIIGIGVNVAVAPEFGVSLARYNLDLQPVNIFNSFKENLNFTPEYIINFLSKKFFKQHGVEANKGEFSGDFKGITQEGNLILYSNGKDIIIKYGDVS